MDTGVDNMDSARSAERLTGKQRVLRGLKYFLWVFVAMFVLGMLLMLCSEKGAPGWWRWGIVFGLVRGLPTAVLAGVIVMAFPRRRLWHGIFAIAVALVACGLFM